MSPAPPLCICDAILPETCRFPLKITGRAARFQAFGGLNKGGHVKTL